MACLSVKFSCNVPSLNVEAALLATDALVVAANLTCSAMQGYQVLYASDGKVLTKDGETIYIKTN